MARGNKNPSPKTRFKPGNNANPIGGAAHSPELRAFKRLTHLEFAEIGQLIIEKDLMKLEEFVRAAKLPNSGISALQVWVASIAIKGIKEGDCTRLDSIMNRVIGKVSERVEHSGVALGPQVIVNLPSNGREIKFEDK